MTAQITQLERDSERARAELAQTLGELRSRMTPGRILDDAVDYFQDGDAAAIAGNLRRQAVGNPLALGLLGVGLAWLMKSNGTAGAATSSSPRLVRRLRAKAETARQRMAGGAQAVADAGQRAADAGSKLADASASVGQAVSDGYEQASQAASVMSENVKESITSVRRQIDHTAANEPFLLVGIGLALGAALEAVSRRRN